MVTNAVTKVAGMLPLAPADESWKEKLGKYAEQAQAASKHSAEWAFIRTSGGRFTYQDEKMPDTIQVVIAGVSRSNEHYAGDYDPDALEPPVCFAVGYDDKTLAPPADLENKVSEVCKGCPNNEFGSASRGRGKACRNQIRLAVLPVGNELNLETLEKEDGAIVRIPPTSLAHFTKYVKGLEALGHFPQTVVTALTIAPTKNQFEITFEAVGGVPTEFGDVITSRAESAEPALLRLPDLTQDEDEDDAPAPKSGKRKEAKY